MTTRLLDKEIPVQGVSDPLAAKTARNSFMDTLRATPRKARAWVASTMRTLHLDSAAGVVSDGALWIYERVLRAGRFLRSLGLPALLGSLLTTPQLRRGAVSAVAKAYGVIRKPFEWIGRGLSWAFGKIGFTAGQNALAAGVARGERAEAWVAGKVNLGLDWLDSNQASPVMTALQGASYGALFAAFLRVTFPSLSAGFRLGANLVSGGVWGLKTYRAVAAEEAAIDRARVVLATPTTKASTLTVAPTVPAELKTVILTDTERPSEEPTFEASAFVDPKGTLRIYLGSQLLTVEDLPDTISLVGEVANPSEVLLPAGGVQPPRAAARATGSMGSRPAKKATHRKR